MKAKRLNPKGVLYGVLAAVCYGTNPLGALNLYAEGFSTDSVLFYRFAFAALFLGITLFFSKEGFGLKIRELVFLFVLGSLFAVTSLTYYGSFNFMDAGLASTLLFLYPLEVAIIMWLFFRERLNKTLGISVFFSLLGIVFLYRGGVVPIDRTGFFLVLLSSLAYAFYIVTVNKSRLSMSSIKLTFWAMLFCLVIVFVYGVLFGSGMPKIPETYGSLGWGVMLGLVPTFLSLVFMAKAVKLVGSTPTAVLGALEALTALVIGICVFDEVLTLRIAIGVSLILFAVTFMAIKKSS